MAVAGAADHVVLELSHGVRVLFTTRRGGVSAAPFDSLNLGLWTDDDPAAVRENRLRVLAAVGAEAFAQGHQVHGGEVTRVTGPPGEPPDADGQATALKTVAPIVLVADCLPVALAAEGAVAMVHAGWRGLAAGVLAEGVRALRDVGGRGPVTAAIGPGAGACCYEAGDEVAAALGAAPRADRRVDLKAAARRQLAEAGVARVNDVKLCTMCSDRSLFFSHRRDGGRTGRQAGVAWRSS